MKLFKSICLVLSCLLCAAAAIAQTCAAPGKDSPGTISGIVNTYYPGGSASLAAGATTLTLGTPASGATGTVTVGDLLLVIQMQGATIDTNDDERYGDGVGTAAATPDSSASQANGYLALNEAGNYDFVRVTAATGSAITFTPALAGTYAQNLASPRRTYQVIRVPQYPSATINSASPVLPLAWTGLVGGVVAIDVAGRTTFSGAGPHMDASNRGFRGGEQGVNDSVCCNTTSRGSRSTLTADGGTKGEGIAGTPRYVQTSVAGAFDSGTKFSDATPTRIDNGAGHVGYTNGNQQRGSPGNAGGGGSSHNSAGGGGGNGGSGGNGGQTYNGDGLRDLGGYGGSRAPQDGVLLATRIFMGGGGGSGSLNDGTVPRGAGGNGGGIVVLRTGSVSGSGVLRSDGQRGWDSDVSNDAGGGGGAGGSVLVQAASGHGSISAQARGGNGADSNLNSGNTAFVPPTGTQGTCCGGEREGPGGGAGGGVVISNSSIGASSLGGGINGLSREDKAQGFSGNMRASSGTAGATAIYATSSFNGTRPGYECLPVLTASKSTSTPTRTVPPDTAGVYNITITNPATGSGAVYGVALSDLLPPPFTLTGTLFTVTFSAGASGAGVTGPATSGFSTVGAGTSTVIFGVPGDPVNAITLQPGAGVTLTFNVALNAATAGTYQNPAAINMTDPTRTSGGAATAATNPYVAPGGTNAAGGTVPGANYVAASSTQEDIVVSGAAGTTADLALVKTGPSTAEVGQAVAYQLVITNSGPSNITGSVTISDSVPAAIGTVTWVCSLFAGTGDCDTASGGTSATGSGNTISLTRVAISSGGEIHIDISGTAASAGSITNTATVSLPAGYTDPVLTNNTGTATTTITVPTADLSVTKSDGATTASTGGVTVYTINAVNSGPSGANNATVLDAAATGLSKLSISCSTQGGATCPSGLSTSTFQAGALIPLFPANSTVTFLLSAQVTAASGTVTNTVSVTGPAGLVEINAGNNSASDADAIVAATAIVTSSAQICPAGSTESTVNLLSNSDFSNTSSSVGTNITQYPVNTNLPDDGVGPQTGARTYGTVTQRPFPGDAGRSVGAATNWLYSNGNAGAVAFTVWSQPVSGLVAGRNYEWLYYGSNAQNPGSATANPPQIQFRLVSGTTTFTLGGTDAYANEAAGTTDTWTLRQRTFGATTTGVTLQIWETQTAGGGTGDTFASTQIILRECVPNTDPFVTKSNGTSTVQTFATTNYIITVGNNGPGAANGIVVKDPAATGLSKTAVSCSAAGTGAQCPLSNTVSGLEGAGLTVPALPANTTLVFTVTATVTALNSTVTNTVSLQLPSGMTDSNLANNSATDIDAVRGSANLSVTKSNGGTTVSAGGFTTYTLIISNSGPSSADGAVVSDPVTAGLSCTTAIACSGTGGALCGVASFPAATLQSGFTIPTFPSGGVITLTETCGVTATGQ